MCVAATERFDHHEALSVGGDVILLASALEPRSVFEQRPGGAR